MANYEYTSDLKADVLFRAGEPTDGTSDYDTQVLAYLNRAYQAICQGGQEFAPDINEDWLWLHRLDVITLEPAVEGTVTVTKNSINITFSTAPTNPEGNAISTAGWQFRVSGHPDVFRINSHISGQTAAQLDYPYTGASGSSRYTAFKLEYVLEPSIMRVRSPMYVRPTVQTFPFRPGEISVVSFEAFRAMFPLQSITAGIPTMTAFFNQNHVWFNAYPTDYVRVEYSYLSLPPALTNGAQESPAIPLKDRRILADAALGLLLVDKNDNRADGILLSVANHLRAMASENRARLLRGDRTFARFYPRLDKMSRAGPARTSGGLVVG